MLKYINDIFSCSYNLIDNEDIDVNNMIDNENLQIPLLDHIQTISIDIENQNNIKYEIEFKLKNLLNTECKFIRNMVYIIENKNIRIIPVIFNDNKIIINY